LPPDAPTRAKSRTETSFESLSSVQPQYDSGSVATQIAAFVVFLVVGEINEAARTVEAPSPADDWRTAMRTRILAARAVLLRHPWAPAVLETRTTVSPGVMHYYESLLGLMRAGGLSYDLAHHALHALGSRALGFTQELFDPEGAEESNEAATQALVEMADQVPHLIEMLAEISHDDPDSTLGWCDDQVEFEFALDLILDGLDRLRDTA
jgi:hypothetical protein